MSEAALAGYLGTWRDAEPQCAIAWLFLRPDERTRFGALAALLFEWRKVIREVREPQVAAVRLGWWREELPRAAAGSPQHPLTQALFGDPRARAIPLRYWAAGIDAAVLALDAAPPADFAAQRDAARPLASAAADLETRLWFRPDTGSLRAAAVATLGELVGALRSLPAEAARGRTVLPMNLLARHGLTIGDLATDGPARRTALRDQIVDLARELAAAARLPGPLSVFGAVRMQHDLATLQRAVRADDPLAALWTHAHGVGALLRTWRAARIWRRETRDETTP